MKLAGWASTSQRDHYFHVVQPGAFAASIKSKGLGGPRGIKFLIKHDNSQPAGIITKLEQRNAGLWLEAVLDEGTSWGRDWASAIRVNKGLNLSVGFTIRDADIERGPDKLEYLLITKGELFEVSLVVEPGNSECVLVEWED